MSKTWIRNISILTWKRKMWILSGKNYKGQHVTNQELGSYNEERDIKGDSAGDEVTMQNCPMFTWVLLHRNRLDEHWKRPSSFLSSLGRGGHLGSNSDHMKTWPFLPPCLPPLSPSLHSLPLSFFPSLPLFLLWTLAMAVGYTAANKTDKISVLMDLQSRGTGSH